MATKQYVGSILNPESQKKEKRSSEPKKEIMDAKVWEQREAEYSVLLGEGAFGKVRKCYVPHSVYLSTTGSSDDHEMTA